LSLVWSLANVSMAFGQKQDVPPTGPKPRAVFAKPTHTRVTDAMHEDLIVVKFREGTHVRARSGRLLAARRNLSPHEEQRLRRANLDHFKIVQEVDLVNELLQPNPSRRFGRLFPRAEHELELEKREGEAKANEELADLNLYYQIFLEGAG